LYRYLKGKKKKELQVRKGKRNLISIQYDFLQKTSILVSS
jgi:hypothetical protein